MSDEPLPLAPGPLPLAGPEVQIAEATGRVGDGLVYRARDGARQARLREYAPAHVVRRQPDGSLRPADPRLALAWQGAAAAFLDQGHRLASFDHPAVAPIWRAASLEGEGVRQGAYLIGAPVGEPLSDALVAGLNLPLAGIVKVAAHLAEVLADLHAAGLTHLDISPQTVSLSSGRLELTDFAIDNRGFMPLLESQDGLVRPGYSPIEHHDASMAEPLGPRADVYGACALLFRLITGRDPVAWQERWRDPSASRLPDHDGYPSGFIEAVRRGMAIEPEDRFADAGAWRAAMGLPHIERLGDEPGRARPLGPTPAPAMIIPVVPAITGPAFGGPGFAEPARAAPPYVDPAFTEPVRPKRGPLLPLLALLLLVAGFGGYLAYTQGWFAPAAGEDKPGNQIASRKETPQKPRPRTPAVPVIAPGATVSGQLGPGDARRGGGQYEDRFTLQGRAGDRLEITLGSGAFDPLLMVTGPGFEAANDDDEARGTRDSRLLVTLPRTGRYTVAVTSYRRGASGDYLLEVQTARPTISVATPAMLAGRWRGAGDAACNNPVIVTIEGDALVFEIEGDRSREQILDGLGRVIRTRPEGADEEVETRYRLSEDGDQFQVEDAIWVRC